MTILLLATLAVFVALAVMGAVSYWLERDGEHRDAHES